jgi:hypothetical protein
MWQSPFGFMFQVQIALAVWVIPSGPAMSQEIPAARFHLKCRLDMDLIANGGGRTRTRELSKMPQGD